MGTLLQWRAAIGNFCLKTGSTNWKPTSTSRTRIQTREKIQFLRNVNASASINSEGKQMCTAVCLFLIKLVGLRYIQYGIDGICINLCIAYNRIANKTIITCHKIGGVFSMLLTCIDKLGVRIFIPTPKQQVAVPVGLLSLISSNMDTTYSHKLTSITSGLRAVALQGIGVFRVFIILTTCFSIVSCQIAHPSDRYVSLTTGFQVSKNDPKNSTITLPSHMKNSCQLGLIIAVKSEQPHSEEEHLNETGNIRFSVSHPNLPESQEEFEISSNEVEFRWKKILHNLCFTNCENIQERTVFLRATTDIAGVKNITITSVRGGDPCEENEKASTDPWKIPAIISIIIAFLVCLFAIILVIKVPARKSSFEALPTDDRQQKVVEIKLPVSQLN